MQRSLVIGLFVVLVVALGAFFLFSRSDIAPPAPNPATPAEQPKSDAAAPAAGAAANDATTRATERHIVAAARTTTNEDPEIQAGLTGWKGRVVDHGKQPVAGCGVRIYRAAQDVIFPENLDIFADESAFVPNYLGGETKTGEDGRFEIHGVWPHAIYILFAGLGTDAPLHQLLTRTPSPGEVVDLGDIQLPDAGVITGFVLDDNGEPLPGALVRAADVPGTLAAFFPVERFDPQGALLIREPGAPVRVVEMPKWVKPAFDDLPIPSTLSGADGAFRLVGVVPGSNMFAVTQTGFLSEVKPSVQVRAGQTKDVGKIKMRRGEELIGRVVDAAGKPVPGAEVLAGSTLSVAPVDLAQRLGVADADGKFTGTGFAPGKVTVAARRGKGHAWFLAEPQSVTSDVTVTLPTTFSVDVTVALADSKPATEVRFRLLQGKAGDGAAEMHLMGFAPALELKERQKTIADGHWRIENLGVGHYTLVADAAGHAMAWAGFEIATADARVALQLSAPRTFTVRVLGQGDKPIRNASVYAEARGARLVEMPMMCGRTDAEGRIVIDKLAGDMLRVSADHPRWGVVHGEVKVGQEVVLRMEAPGSLRGLLLENGKPAAPGKFSIAMMRKRGDGQRGALENMPALLTSGADGTFFVAALQPGSYELTAIKALDGLRSPGGLVSMMQEAFLWRQTEQARVDIAAGQEANVQLEAGEKPIEGPTGTIAGSVTIDGKLGVGYMVVGYSEGRRSAARVDERGRFDLGAMPVGNVWVNVQANGSDGVMFGGGSALWSSNVDLKQAEAKEMVIEVATSTISGIVVLPDGSPGAGLHVQAQGRLKSAIEGQGDGSCWLGAPTDAEGRFQFAQVPEGTWSLTADRRSGDPARGSVSDLAVRAGVPMTDVRIEMKPTLVVKGRVDFAAFGATKPQWVWIAFYRPTDKTPPGQPGDHVDSAGVDMNSGNFMTSDLTPGPCRVRIHVAFEDKEGQEYECQDIDVPPTGLTDVVLRPGRVVK